MTRRSPIAAMLWELWRVTRIEAAWKLASGAVVPLTTVIVSAVLAPYANAGWYGDLTDNLVVIGRMIIYLPHIMGWVSVAALSGGRLGFPLYLYYSRPIPTAVMVGVPMAYLTFVTFVICLVSAFLLRATAGYPYSLVPAAAWIAVLTVVVKTIGWWARSMVVLMLGIAVALFSLGNAIGSRLDSFPRGIDYPLTDYAVMALISLVCFGLTVATVARQRRGDAQAAVTSTPGSGLWAWLIDRFRFRCPTSSATRAQVWLALKSNGWPVLTMGVGFAILILLVSAVSGPIDAALNADPDVTCQIEECFFVRAATPLMITPFALLTIFLLGGNAFDIRRKQGRAYVSAFDAAQAYGTAQLTILKLLVQSVCVLAAVIAIGASLWISMPLLGDAVFVQIWGVPLSSRRPVIVDAFAGLASYEQVAMAIVAAVGVVVGVAAFAVFRALRTRYSHRVSIASVLLALYGLVFAWLAVAVRLEPEIASRYHLDVVYGAMSWSALAAMGLTTAYLFWSGFAEHVLTVRYVGGAVAISAAFGAAWLTVLQMAGAQQAGISTANAVSIVSAALLPLMASMLAPWSYSRIRHL
jgi:hypothetical protein